MGNPGIGVLQQVSGEIRKRFYVWGSGIRMRSFSIEPTPHPPSRSLVVHFTLGAPKTTCRWKLLVTEYPSNLTK